MMRDLDSRFPASEDLTARDEQLVGSMASSQSSFQLVREASARSDDIPTVGQYAEIALTNFSALQESGSVQYTDRPRHLAALELVRACLSLMDKFPEQSRQDFASTLPFTDLELRLLRRPQVEDESVTAVIASRLDEWVHRSPIFVNDANVHAAEFLVRLTPHLDLWSQRERAAQAIRRVCSLEDDTETR